MVSQFCARCGVCIEGEVVEFTGRFFCSEACCERFESIVIKAGEPAADDLHDSHLYEGDMLDLLEDVDDGFDSAVNDC